MTALPKSMGEFWASYDGVRAMPDDWWPEQIHVDMCDFDGDQRFDAEFLISSEQISRAVAPADVLRMAVDALRFHMWHEKERRRLAQL